MTGLHFIVNDTYYRIVAPCIKFLMQLLKENVLTNFCSAKSSGKYLDEHFLWMTLRLCGLNPGPRISQRSFYSMRPIHGAHVHGRRLIDNSDQQKFCQGFSKVEKYLYGKARGRYLRLKEQSKCGEKLS